MCGCCSSLIKLTLKGLKGLCHGSPVQFANYSPSIGMELKVSKEITRK